jgi:hypothetical protein
MANLLADAVRLPIGMTFGMNDRSAAAPEGLRPPKPLCCQGVNPGWPRDESLPWRTWLSGRCCKAGSSWTLILFLRGIPFAKLSGLEIMDSGSRRA